LRSRLGPITLDISKRWADVTEEGGPWTLVRQTEDATGALQFSVALFESGREPGVTVEHLEEMLRESGATHGLGEMFDGRKSEGQLLIAAGSFHSKDGYFFRVWYASDGRNIAFVTFTTLSGSEGNELPDCEAMVASIEFPPLSVT
jgi:hypothetical protein